MSIAKRVFELQQVELLILGHSKRLDEIRIATERNVGLELARESLTCAEAGNLALERAYRELDAEAETVRANIKQINDKLYGGKINNPKELVGYEQEAKMLKSGLAEKDDRLIALMEGIESGKRDISKLAKQFGEVEASWGQEKVVLAAEADKIKSELVTLEAKRAEMSASLDTSTIDLYRGIAARKGMAVVRVEQGRCLGCRVTLSVSELQHVRGNAIVTCSNCGRILYLS